LEGNVTNLSDATVIKAQSDAQIERMSEIHQFSTTELEHLKILYQGSPNAQSLKVFRDLRTRLYSKSGGKNFLGLVTSVTPSGGCSYVVKNLAAAISLDRTRTSLVVDCNFYSPSMDSLIVTDTELGITDYLDANNLGIETIVHASGIPRLRVIPVGNNTEGATERLSSARMQLFLRELKTRYSDRYILVDAPSIGEYSAEARIMAGLCDFVVLVVPYGKVTLSQVQKAVEAIGKNSLAGIVYNYM